MSVFVLFLIFSSLFKFLVIAFHVTWSVSLPHFSCGFFCSVLNQNANLFLKVGLSVLLDFTLMFEFVDNVNVSASFKILMSTEAHSWELAMAINLDIGKLLISLNFVIQSRNVILGKDMDSHMITVDDFDLITWCPLPFK